VSRDDNLAHVKRQSDFAARVQPHLRPRMQDSVGILAVDSEAIVSENQRYFKTNAQRHVVILLTGEEVRKDDASSCSKR